MVFYQKTLSCLFLLQKKNSTGVKIYVAEQENRKNLGNLNEKLDNYFVRSECIIYG